MKKVPKNVLDLPLEERALLALKEAVKDAIEENWRRGVPVYVWKDGDVVELPPPASIASSPASLNRKPRSGQ